MPRPPDSIPLTADRDIVDPGHRHDGRLKLRHVEFLIFFLIIKRHNVSLRKSISPCMMFLTSLSSLPQCESQSPSDFFPNDRRDDPARPAPLAHKKEPSMWGQPRKMGSSRFLRERAEKRVAKRAQKTSNCSCYTNKKEVKLCSRKRISQLN